MAEGDFINHKLRHLLEDWFTDQSTLSGVDEVFGAAGIPLAEGIVSSSGARRTRVRSYYASLDPTSRSDLRRFSVAAADVVERIQRQTEGTPWRPVDADAPDPLAPFQRELAKLGYAYASGKILATSVIARRDDAKMHADAFNLAHFSEHVRRIEGAIDTDPAQAIGSAKELVETIAKTTLDQRGISYGRSEDMPKLAKAAFGALRQLPDNVPDAAKGAEIIKRTLSKLASVVQGLAEIRGLYGTGHGHTGATRGISARHAKLAVSAATTLTAFLMDTHKETPLPLPRNGGQ